MNSDMIWCNQCGYVFSGHAHVPTEVIIDWRDTEIKRLREALQEVKNCKVTVSKYEPWPSQYVFESRLEDAVSIATEALAKDARKL